VLPRLKVVDFSMGVMSAASVAALRTHAARFKHLEKLVLDDNYFSEAELAELKQVLPNIEAGEQKTEDDPGYRYTTVGE
jgi:hypothetical protein